MEICPRCKRRKLDEEKVMNALSRRDNKTYICSDCGTEEAMFDFEVRQMIDREREWLKKE